MKNKKKIVALLLVLVLAITSAVGATLAYFTDTEDATNVFTVGNVDITLKESAVEGLPANTGKNTNNFFSYVDADDNARTVPNDKLNGNTYDNLVPGSVICKDPTVTNVGANDAYLRVTLIHNNNEEIFTYFTQRKFLQAVVGLEETTRKATRTDVAWKLKNGTYGGVTGFEDKLEDNQKVYVFYFDEIFKAAVKDTTGNVTAPADEITLFSQINVPTAFDHTEMAAFKDLEINIIAEAIQADGFANVEEAFTAYDAQVNS